MLINTTTKFCERTQRIPRLPTLKKHVRSKYAIRREEITLAPDLSYEERPVAILDRKLQQI